MHLKFFRSALLPVLLFSISNSASSLTIGQLQSICASASHQCSENQALQTYVGGALDLIATLDEANHLKESVCKNKKTLLKVPEIIHFMEENRTEPASKNAMFLLILYLEKNGGCQND